MTLQEAIEILIDLKRYDYNPTNPDAEDAIQLLIEAGKRCQRLRSDKHCSPTKLLPGETED